MPLSLELFVFRARQKRMYVLHEFLLSFGPRRDSCFLFYLGRCACRELRLLGGHDGQSLVTRFRRSSRRQSDTFFGGAAYFIVCFEDTPPALNQIDHVELLVSLQRLEIGRGLFYQFRRATGPPLQTASLVVLRDLSFFIEWTADVVLSLGLEVCEKSHVLALRGHQSLSFNFVRRRS